MSGFLFSELIARTIEEGDCRLWTGPMGSHNTPEASRKGVKSYVRREIWALTHEQSVPPCMCVIAKCGDLKCISPDHLVLATKAQVIRRTAKTGVFQTPQFRAAVAKAKRKTSKLSQDDVASIRASDESNAVMAERYGMTFAMICMIRSNLTRKNYNDQPFAGLGAR